MKNESLDRLILGHNQFFGISHMSSERGIAREQYFSDINNIIDIIRYAYQKGAGGLMLSTHERSRKIAARLREDKQLSENLRLYILLPYMAKYVRMANEIGMVRMVTDMLNQAGMSEKLGIGLRAGIGIIRDDKFSKLRSLIDIELLSFKGLNIRAILLHNSLTDLAVGLDMIDVIRFFCEYVSKRYHVEPGLCTLSSGFVMKRLCHYRGGNPIIMAPFNPVGFQMNPSRQACEQFVRETHFPVIAMSPLAAGSVKPQAAASYISGLSNIKSVVVGTSSRGHIDETFKAFLPVLEAKA